jgi:hypothetical protein
MEKLDNNNQPDSLRTRLKTMPVAEALHVQHAPIKLERPLKLFNGALGVRPGISEYPDPEFVLHILEGAGHQQVIRRHAGSQFKNLENFLRRSHATSPTTWKLIQQALKLDEESSDVLRTLAHGHADGPLLPAYITMARALEGVFLRTYRFATVGIFICECCGTDKLDNARIWWPKQIIPLEPDASAFVDRLLSMLVGGTVLYEKFGAAESMGSAMLDTLAMPDTHPIGNWMTAVRIARGLQKDLQLLPEPVADGRLRKWRSGQDLMPLGIALYMIRGAPSPTRLKHALLAARTLALAIDVVQAAASTTNRPTRRAAQEVVSARLKQLLRHFELGVLNGFEDYSANGPCKSSRY